MNLSPPMKKGSLRCEAPRLPPRIGELSQLYVRGSRSLSAGLLVAAMPAEAAPCCWGARDQPDKQLLQGAGQLIKNASAAIELQWACQAGSTF